MDTIAGRRTIFQKTISHYRSRQSFSFILDDQVWKEQNLADGTQKGIF